MDCPFCKAELDIAIQDLNQVYYDCPHCESALFIEAGRCELVSEGQKKASPVPENLKDQTQTKDLQTEEELIFSPEEEGENEKQAHLLQKEKEEKEEQADSFPEEADQAGSLLEEKAQAVSYKEENQEEEQAGVLQEEEKQEQEGSPQEEEFQTEGPVSSSFEEPAKKTEQAGSLQDEEERPSDSLSAMTSLEEEILPEERTEVPELSPSGEEEEDFLEGKSEFSSTQELSRAEPEFSSIQGLSKEEAEIHELSKEESPANLKESLLEKKSDSSVQSPAGEENSHSLSQNFAEEDFKDEEKSFSKTVETNALNEEEKEDSEKEGFSEVAQFGNTQNEDKEGPFLYNLLLSEINSKNIKQEVLSVLNDENLNLNLYEEEDFNKALEEGKILIKKISPLKTYIIVHSLMGLPLNISWTQQHIAEKE